MSDFIRYQRFEFSGELFDIHARKSIESLLGFGLISRAVSRGLRSFGTGEAGRPVLRRPALIHGAYYRPRRVTGTQLGNSNPTVAKTHTGGQSGPFGCVSSYSGSISWTTTSPAGEVIRTLALSGKKSGSDSPVEQSVSTPHLTTHGMPPTSTSIVITVSASGWRSNVSRSPLKHPSAVQAVTGLEPQPATARITTERTHKNRAGLTLLNSYRRFTLDCSLVHAEVDPGSEIRHLQPAGGVNSVLHVAGYLRPWLVGPVVLIHVYLVVQER